MTSLRLLVGHVDGFRSELSAEQTAAAVIVHDHVHLGGFDQIGVEIEAEDGLAGLVNLREELLLLCGGRAFGVLPGLARLLAKLLGNVVEGNDDESRQCHRRGQECVRPDWGRAF